MLKLKEYVEISRVCGMSRKGAIKWEDELLGNEV